MSPEDEMLCTVLRRLVPLHEALHDRRDAADTIYRLSTSEDALKARVAELEARSAAGVVEKDCQTCAHIDGDSRCAVNDSALPEAQCILGSRYERAAFTALWRTE